MVDARCGSRAWPVGAWAEGLIYAVCIALALVPAWLHRVERRRLFRGLAAAGAIAALYLPCLLMMARRASDWGTGWLSWEPAMALQLLGLYTIPVEVLTISSAVAALIMILLAKRAIVDGLEDQGLDQPTGPSSCCGGDRRCW